MHNQFKYIFFIYIVFLFVLHTVPLGPHIAPDEYVHITMRPDQILHFILFMPYCIFLRIWLKIDIYSNPWLSVVMILIGLFLAFSLEALHIILPYRSFEIGDLLANLLGTIIGSSAFAIRM